MIARPLSSALKVRSAPHEQGNLQMCNANDPVSNAMVLIVLSHGRGWRRLRRASRRDVLAIAVPELFEMDHRVGSRRYAFPPGSFENWRAATEADSRAAPLPCAPHWPTCVRCYARAYSNERSGCDQLCRAAGCRKPREHGMARPLQVGIRLLRLPPCAPGLNPQENLWDDLRAKECPSRVFADLQCVLA